MRVMKLIILFVLNIQTFFLRIIYNYYVQIEIIKKQKVMFLMSLVLLSSCSIMEKQQFHDKQPLLVASGFKMQLANTSENLNYLKTLEQGAITKLDNISDNLEVLNMLTQYKLLPYEKKSEAYYIFVDVDSCKCFFWGLDQANERFLLLQEQQNIDINDRNR